MRLTHLSNLESEAIEIMREVVSEAENPVMLYSVGKDSAVLLHLAKKAFFPSPPPFPLMHVDTTWKFQEMYKLRDKAAKDAGMELIVHQNPEAKEKGINPFDHGVLHTDMWKTEGLKQALDKHGFDAAFGGARRDEEECEFMCGHSGARCAWSWSAHGAGVREGLECVRGWSA